MQTVLHETQILSLLEAGQIDQEKLLHSCPILDPEILLWIAQHGTERAQQLLLEDCKRKDVLLVLAEHGSFDVKYKIAVSHFEEDVLLAVMRSAPHTNPKEIESIMGQVLIVSEPLVLRMAQQGSFVAKHLLARRCENDTTITWLIADDDLKILQALIKRELSFDHLVSLCTSTHQQIVWNALDRLSINHQAITAVFHDHTLLKNTHVVSYAAKYAARI